MRGSLRSMRRLMKTETAMARSLCKFSMHTWSLNSSFIFPIRASHPASFTRVADQVRKASSCCQAKGVPCRD